MRELQRLIAMMMRSERKYLDPSAVLAALRDHKGQPVAIGGQQDVGGPSPCGAPMRHRGLTGRVDGLPHRV